jgi:RNA 2',3'-cyclic 3'-phosphodiesterase
MSKPANTIRAFIGIALPDDLNQQLDLDCRGLRQQPNIRKANLRWLQPHNRHMTLAFLGDIEREIAEEKWQQFDHHLINSPTTISLDQIDHFPDKRSRIIAITSPVNTELTKLRKELQELFHLDASKPLRPHITLARIPKNQQLPFPPVTCDRRLPIDAIHLYKSTLGPGGSEYEILLSHQLHDRN